MTTRRFADRCAVVTGGGDGIGRAMARRFAAEGAGVIVAEFDRDSGESAAEEFRVGGGEARFVATDVTDKAQVMAMMAQAARAFASFEPEPNKKFDKLYEVYSQRFQREDFEEGDAFDPHVLPKSYLEDPQPKHAFVYVAAVCRRSIGRSRGLDIP